MKSYLVLFLFTFILLVGCIEKEEISENAIIAKTHIEKMGYDVVSLEDEGSIQFNKSQLLELPGQQIWGVQYVEPDNYLNKEIDTISFMVKNHPLDDMYDEGKTNVTVYLIKEKVIGGWSFPHSEEHLDGGVYSLDGKTIEEIHGDFQKWQVDWENKYKN